MRSQSKGVNAICLLDKVQLKDKKIVTKQALLEVIKNSDFEVLVTIGAGDIDTFVEPIEALWRDDA